MDRQDLSRQVLEIQFISMKLFGIYYLRIR